MACGLKQGLGEKVGGERVLRVGFDGSLQQGLGRFGLAQVEVQDSAHIHGAGMVRFLHQNIGEDIEGAPFVAFLLPVQRGYRPVDLRVEPTGSAVDDFGERLFRCRVLVLPHEGDAEIIQADVVGRWLGVRGAARDGQGQGANRGTGAKRAANASLGSPWPRHVL